MREEVRSEKTEKLCSQSFLSLRVCTVRKGTNQYARTSFEIRDEYWPYHRIQNVEGAVGQAHNAYVDAIKRSFVSLGCTIGKFSARDAQLAEEFQRRRIPLELVQDALLMGACRKYISWLNGGSAEPIGSLRYFEGLVAEIRERPLPADYREYLQKKVEQLTRAWTKESVKLPKKGGCSGYGLPGDRSIAGRLRGDFYVDQPGTWVSPGLAKCLRKKVTSKNAKKETR